MRHFVETYIDYEHLNTFLEEKAKEHKNVTPYHIWEHIAKVTVFWFYDD